MNERDKELAKQVGMVYREFEDEFANANTDGVDQKTMQKFADLIRADEREALIRYFDGHWRDEWSEGQIIEALEARGNT